MQQVFYLVGPTAAGKSEIAVEAAREFGAEIVNADAFQIYAGLDLLTAKPEAELLTAVRHHLIGTVPLTEEMNAERFRVAALGAIEAVHAQGKPAFVVGGSGMYIKALTHGLSPLPPANLELRERLQLQSLPELAQELERLDPETARTIDLKNQHRVVRALEICLLTGQPVSAQRQRAAPAHKPRGVLIYRDRAALYARIDARVVLMFARGVIDEVRLLGELGATAARTLGLQQIHDLISGRNSERECIASIQQATRRYAKRQLTWFQRQTSFEPLNLSLHGSSEAIESIARKARLAFASQDD